MAAIEDRGPMSHLLVTNDFPPKVGGIQSYLWELWRRLPPDRFAVLTTSHPNAEAFDVSQPFRVGRTGAPVLLPTRGLARRITTGLSDLDARLVVLDPALPLGLIGPRLGVAYAVVLHGAEVTVPGRLPGSRSLLRRVLRGATHVVAAGQWVADQASAVAGRPLETTVVPPGVDTDRFRPLDDRQRAKARAGFGLPAEGRVVVSVSRLVPRKGMDTLIEAAALLAHGRSDLTVAVAGGGRDRSRLDRLVRRSGAPVRMLGRVDDDDLPALYGCADVFAMLARSRWGGLEQEGFGIVFLEAAACGVPQVAGASGGVAEAVAAGETGFLVNPPKDAHAAAAALALLLDDPSLRAAQGAAGRTRAEQAFSYGVLAANLDEALVRLEGSHL
jgi:phosphatidylinositol alpha-1,6-mannosyltransferase